MSKRLSIGSRLYLSVLSLFIVFAIAFVVFQQYREKQYRIERLNLRLQDFNSQVHDAYTYNKVRGIVPFMSAYMQEHRKSGLRVTVIRRDGTVVYDNMRHDYDAMGNHLQRPEVAKALRSGSGSTVERNSASTGQDYFYSATYFPRDGYVVRSAMPYNINLAKNLQTDQHYIWFALIIMVILIIVLYKFIHRLGTNIAKLNEFAAKASSSPSTIGNDWGEVLSHFSNDELGDTAERIVKLYITLERTQQEQSVLKRQLTQNVAHELKTPVASIQGYLETILENPKVDEKMRRQFLERCYAQSQRLTSLLADMSMLNRMDDGARMMTFENVDVAEIIRTVEKESQFAMEQKGMKMDVEMPEHVIINGNRSLLYSIFRNLADNAIAYSCGTLISVKCERQSKPSDIEDKQQTVWHFTFADNGNGVGEEHLPRLFERFYRVDKGRSRKMGGTGLGLAIVKNAVLLHGGKISVKNRQSGGLQFDFTMETGFLR